MLLPVIMAGGSGSRLWPLSRGTHPKQFLTLDGDRTMLLSAAQGSAAILWSEGGTGTLAGTYPVLMTGTVATSAEVTTVILKVN